MNKQIDKEMNKQMDKQMNKAPSSEMAGGENKGENKGAKDDDERNNDGDKTIGDHDRDFLNSIAELNACIDAVFGNDNTNNNNINNNNNISNNNNNSNNKGVDRRTFNSNSIVSCSKTISDI